MRNVSMLELTRDEIVRRIEEASRQRKGMSASDLVRAYRKGRLTDPGEVADILVLADLLPEDDPIFEAA